MQESSEHTPPSRGSFVALWLLHGLRHPTEQRPAVGWRQDQHTVVSSAHLLQSRLFSGRWTETRSSRLWIYAQFLRLNDTRRADAPVSQLRPSIHRCLHGWTRSRSTGYCLVQKVWFLKININILKMFKAHPKSTICNPPFPIINFF